MGKLSEKEYERFLNGFLSTFENVRPCLQYFEISASSHLMHVVAIVIDFKHYPDNFQPLFVVRTAKFHMKTSKLELDPPDHRKERRN